MEKKKFEVKGNETLYREIVGLIKQGAEDLDHDAYSLSQNQTFGNFDRVLKGIEELHAYAANMMAFLRYRAFEFGVVLEANTAEEPAVQEAE